MYKPPRIVFFGTPSFARQSLQALCEQGFHVAGVVSVPDKASGRGLQMQSSDVATYAKTQGLPLAQPDSLKEASFLERLQSWDADLFVVVAFRMLPKAVWQMPRLGTFNLHASLLPQYRGAAPINWALIQGENETGITTFLIDENIDTGSILFQERLPILPEDNAGDLHDRLMYAGAQLVCRTVQALALGKVRPQVQISSLPLQAAPKLSKALCQISWDATPTQIVNLIRGLSPYPAAWSSFYADEQTPPLPVKIFAASAIKAKHDHSCGSLIEQDKAWWVACKGGYVSILELQFPGKKRLPIKEFLAGFRKTGAARFQHNNL
jgi:methionyl-tRNA formyltransferase